MINVKERQTIHVVTMMGKKRNDVLEHPSLSFSHLQIHASLYKCTHTHTHTPHKINMSTLGNFNFCCFFL